MKNYPTLATAFLLIVLSCHKDQERINTKLFSTWEVKSFMSIESVAYPKIEGNSILITFNREGTYQLKLDVNQCSGNFILKSENQIELGSAGCTEACCDSEFSQKLAAMLPNVESFTIENQTLKLEVPQWGWIECERIK